MFPFILRINSVKVQKYASLCQALKLQKNPFYNDMLISKVLFKIKHKSTRTTSTKVVLMSLLMA